MSKSYNLTIFAHITNQAYTYPTIDFITYYILRKREYTKINAIKSSYTQTSRHDNVFSSIQLMFEYLIIKLYSHTHTHTHTHARAHMCVCVCVCVSVCIHKHIYIV